MPGGSAARFAAALAVLAAVRAGDEDVFRRQINELKGQAVDMFFLIDGSSSVGEANFRLEIGFVKKLLSDFTVSDAATRVSIIVFGNHAATYEHPDKCELLNSIIPNIVYPGGGTNTLGALLATKHLLNRPSLQPRRKVIFLVTDGFSNGGDPLPTSHDIKTHHNLTIFTLGIRTGNARELQALASPDSSYLLESFQKFDFLARKALHSDLKDGDYIPVEPGSCEGCDPLASCVCGISSGQYVCQCRPGYYGTGKPSECFPCPVSTFWQAGVCVPCPDVNHITDDPSIGPDSCHCKPGYEATPHGRCDVITCPQLEAPENGYFVGVKECPNVMNAACGVRCNVGYNLRGNSIRVCRQDGAWDGVAPRCHLKTCPKPPVPQNGHLECVNPDLDIRYDTLPEEMPVDTECSYNCSLGHSLAGSQKRTCLPVQQWDGLATRCKPQRCARLLNVPHGRVLPEACSTTKQDHGAACRIVCDPGFHGPEQVHCVSKGRHGSWSQKPKCLDITPPEITCPPDVQTPSQGNTSYAPVTWDPPVIFDNSLEVNFWFDPSQDYETLQGPWRFEIGVTQVTYHAVDPSGNHATCNFSVEVLDNDPPVFDPCEDPPTFLIGAPGVEIQWEKPAAWDNSGEVTILESRDHGVLPEGVTQVAYTAVDPSNNTATCLLNITVLVSSCEAQVPVGNCSEVPGGLQCVLTCEEGYAFPVTDEATCDNLRPYWQIPDCTPTEIPEEIVGEGSGEICQDLEEKCAGGVCQVVACGSERSKRAIDGRKREKRGGKFVAAGNQHGSLPGSGRNHHLARKNVRAQVGSRSGPVPRSKRQITNIFGTQQPPTTQFRLRLTSPKLPSFPASASLKPLCRNGTVPSKMRFRCVKCPKGTYHNLGTKRCEACAIDSYNDVIGSTSCFRCPTGKATRGRKGSRSVSACKKKLARPGAQGACRDETCIHGRCVPVGRLRHRCVCEPGWIGARCRLRKINHCLTQPCLNGGACLSRRRGYSCRCPEGFSGEDCDLEAQELEETHLENVCAKFKDLCQNNGTCHSLGDGFRCACRPGFLGRRCQIVPCDYRPCPATTVCRNAGVVGEKTTRKSFRCECPQGRAGFPTCHQVVDKCGCQNNGTCLEPGVCSCQKTWTGPRCMDRLRPDYALYFPKPGVSDFSIAQGPGEDLKALTLCAWVKTNSSSSYGTIFSYATPESDNTLTLLDYGGLVVWINAQYDVTRLQIADGTWHQICLTWSSLQGDYKIFSNGQLKASGSISKGVPIKGSGTIVLGQEQDAQGGGFSRIESFTGEMTYVDVWSRVIPQELLPNPCQDYQPGDWVSWVEFRKGARGALQIIPNTFCSPCPPLNSLLPGGTLQVAPNGTQLTLNCQKGHQVVIEGRYPAKNPMATRKCLASGRWEDQDVPWRCQKVQCNQPPRIKHARITSRRKRTYKFDDRVVYACLDGYDMIGDPGKTCQDNGDWSGSLECVGSHCLPFAPPDGSNVTFLSEHVYDEDFKDIRRFDVGTVLEVQCLEELVVATCLDNQTWDKDLSKCQEEAATTEPVAEAAPVLEGPANESSEATSEASKDFPSTTQVVEKEEEVAKLQGELLEESTSLVGDPKETLPEPGASMETPDASKEKLPEPDISKEETLVTVPLKVEPTKLAPTTEETSQTVPSEQEPPQTVPSQEELPQTVPTKEESPQTVPSKEKPPQIVPSKEEPPQTVPSKEEPPQTVASKDELPQTVSSKEEPPQIVPSKEEPPQTVASKDELPQTVSSKEKEPPQPTSPKELPQTASSKEESIENPQILPSEKEPPKTGAAEEDPSQAGSSTEEPSQTTPLEEDSPEASSTAPPEDLPVYSTSCQGADAPLAPNNGYMADPEFDNQTEYEAGSVLGYKCRTGYVLRGFAFVTCQNGSWLENNVSCEPIRCPPPPSFQSMRPRQQPGADVHRFGNIIYYECEPGFSFYGNNVARCLANGRWSRLRGKCARISCGKPKISDGREVVIGSSYLYKDSLRVMCPRQARRESYEARCTEGGEWLYLGSCEVGP